MKRLAVRYAMVALLFWGSATLLFSCADPDAKDSAADETLMTEYSEDLSIVESKNGRRSYFFTTPLVEGYKLARDPYREFRKGVKITTYLDDSLTTVDAVLTANYAIFYEKRELWEAKGNVVVEKSDGKRLYTQQLFWNLRTKKIYSNVDTKIVQSGGNNTFIGEGFESDEEFKDWRFRRMKGRMEVDVSPTETDSTTLDKPAADSVASASVASGTVRSGDSAKSEPASATVRPAVSPRAEAETSRRANRNLPAAEQRTTEQQPASRVPAAKLEPVELKSEPTTDIKKK